METNTALIPVNTLPVKLSKASFKPILAAIGRSDYNGRKFRARAQKSYSVNNGDLVWGGGSRTTVWFLRVEAGRLEVVDARDALPNALRDGAATFSADIPANILVVEHSVFCGVDAGYTLIAAPRTAALPPAIAAIAAPPIAALPAHE